jgi:hypothetical protein
VTKTIAGFTKIKKFVQAHSDASGWNKHVNKFQKKIGNKVVRRLTTRDTGSCEYIHD